MVNSDANHTVPENIFSSNNPKTFCTNCNGLGIEMVISQDLLVPNPDKTLRDGAILYYKGAVESKEQKCLEAICEHYGIDIDKKYSKLTKMKFIFFYIRRKFYGLKFHIKKENEKTALCITSRSYSTIEKANRKCRFN